MVSCLSRQFVDNIEQVAVLLVYESSHFRHRLGHERRRSPSLLGSLLQVSSREFFPGFDQEDTAPIDVGLRLFSHHRVRP